MGVFGQCRYREGIVVPHSGSSDQPMACPLTADGVPMQAGMKLWDRNGDEYKVVDVWSEGFNDGSTVRFITGCFITDDRGSEIMQPRWGNLFAAKQERPT